MSGFILFNYLTYSEIIFINAVQLNTVFFPSSETILGVIYSVIYQTVLSVSFQFLKCLL